MAIPRDAADVSLIDRRTATGSPTGNTAAPAPAAAVRFLLASLIAGSLMGTTLSPAQAQTGEGAYCTIDEFSRFLNVLKPVDGKIKLSVEPNKSTWRVGDAARFSVVSPMAGELLLMSVDSKGIVVPIFPNSQFRAGDSSMIAANSVLTLPAPGQGFGFEMMPPLGQSRLIAIVRPEGRKLPLACAQALTKGAPVELTGPGEGSTPPLPVPAIYDGWGFAAFDYAVRE